VIGLGVGRRYDDGGPAFWAQECARLRERAPVARIAAAGYGPKLMRTAGGMADAVLLNWMTPERVRWATDLLDAGAAAAGRQRPSPIYLYLSAAVGPGAAERIDAAMTAFRAYPYHRRHQDAMAATETVGIAVSQAEEIEPALGRYEGVVALINPIGEVSAQDRERLLEFFSPRSAPGRS
jgi:alkanesulfonate monooxygenase SsuD/methylene tetrahydromethanopterin reductase-like flavin-dependent oxidoreductase (luciferase family)